MNKLLIAVLILGFTLAQSSILEKHQKEQNFLNYSKQHNKKYSSLEESLYRFSIYKDNVKEIDQLNSDVANATFALNKFSDLTHEEFLAKFTGAVAPPEKSPSDRKLESESHARNLGSYPASLDLRTKKGMQPIRWQGTCGSCWTFSAVSTIEYAYWKQTGYAGDLSEQHLVDCVYTYGGCGGGWMYTAYEYISKNGGIAWEWDYKYEEKNGACKAAQMKGKISVMLDQKKSYVQVASDDDSIKSALANVGVLSVCVDAWGWSGYRSGIYEDKRFADQKVNPRCTHAVNIVGYGSEKGIPYYIIRNSWDTWWGEQGYMKMDARRYPNGNTYSGLMLTKTYYPILY